MRDNITLTGSVWNSAQTVLGKMFFCLSLTVGKRAESSEKRAKITKYTKVKTAVKMYDLYEDG